MSKGRSVVNSNGFAFLLGRRGQTGRSVVSKGRIVVNSVVFVCFCMVEGRKCRKVSCFCVFLLGRRAEMSKSVVFLCVFARLNGVKCRTALCFCVFLLGRRGAMWKSVVFVFFVSK